MRRRLPRPPPPPFASSPPRTAALPSHPRTHTHPQQQWPASRPCRRPRPAGRERIHACGAQPQRLRRGLRAPLPGPHGVGAGLEDWGGGTEQAGEEAARTGTGCPAGAGRWSAPGPATCRHLSCPAAVLCCAARARGGALFKRPLFNYIGDRWRYARAGVQAIQVVASKMAAHRRHHGGGGWRREHTRGRGAPSTAARNSRGAAAVWGNGSYA